MVMARRPLDGGRRAPRRYPRVVIAVAVGSLVFLAASSIVRSSARGPDAAVAYADRVRPSVDRSTRQAAAVDDLRNQVGTLPADALKRALDRLVREGNDQVEAVRDAKPPGDLDAAQGLLVTCLKTRARLLAVVRDALIAPPDQRPTDAVARALADVGRQLQVSDAAYDLFLAELPAVARKTMPASTWVGDATRWEYPEMAAMIATVRSSQSSAPVNDVVLITANPTPAPVGSEGGAQVLPKSRTLLLDVVVANAGNTAQKRVAVEGVVTSVGGLDTGRQFVDLAPGQRAAVTLTLRPAAGPNLDVRIKVGPVEGEVAVVDNERSIAYIVR